MKYLLALVGTLLVCAPQPLSANEESRPNILLIVADDLGYGDLGMGNPDSKIPTPNLDRLAAEGMRFIDAHSSSGICSPSRYALLTGRFHWRKFHDIVHSFGPSVFDDAELTLPEMLKARGYRTACIGKWHLGWDWDAIRREGTTADPKTGYAPDAFDWSRSIPGGPLAHGFDSYFGDDVPNFPPYTWIEDERVVMAPTKPLTITPQTAEGAWEARPGPMAADWDFYAVMPTLTQKAVAWIETQRDEQPFFLYVPFTSPHAPIVPTGEFTGRSRAGGYGDYVAQTDAAVGNILAALQRAGVRERTLVIFTSDNGPEHYAYQRIRNYEHRSAGPLRGLKRDLWEGGHRVPFVVRWPGHAAAGAVHEGLISQVDIMATLAHLVGYKLSAGEAEDSYDLLAVLTQSAASPRQSIVHNTQPQRYAVRDGKWLLVATSTGGVSRVPPWFDEENGYAKNDQPGELYDLTQDLAQRHNLYAERSGKVAELTTLLQRILQSGQVR